MTLLQIKQADLLLEIFQNHDGQLNKDDLGNILDNMKLDRLEYEFTKERLIEHYRLIDYVFDGKYWMILTPQGEKATKIGMNKHLEQLEYERSIELEKKIVSIKGIKKANILSILAIVTAIFGTLVSLFK